MDARTASMEGKGRKLEMGRQDMLEARKVQKRREDKQSKWWQEWKARKEIGEANEVTISPYEGKKAHIANRDSNDSARSRWNDFNPLSMERARHLCP